MLDAGCGWGLASVFCARAFAAEVTAVDIDPEVFPYLHLHADLNEVAIQTLQVSFDEIPAELLASQDLIIGADICFREHMVAPIHHLVERAFDDATPRLLLADPGRPSFKNLCTLCSASVAVQSIPWQVQEPLIEWPGKRPTIAGQLLIAGALNPSPA